MRLKITIENRVYEVEVEAFEPIPEPAELRPSSGPVLPPPAQEPGPGSSDKVGRSPVAGVVVRIPAALGQTVAAGDTIVVLEAMKMETNLTAACAGVLKSVSVKIGDTIVAGQVLFELDEA